MVMLNDLFENNARLALPELSDHLPPWYRDFVIWRGVDLRF